MPRLIGRIKCMRMCDILLLLTVLGNLFYVLYYRSTITQSDVTDRDKEVKTINSGVAIDSPRKLVESAHEDVVQQVVPMTGAKENISREETKDTSERVQNITEPCQKDPPFLIGSLACECDPVKPEFLVTHYPDMKRGGRLRPLSCIPDQRLAVVIPYRNRYDHLHTLLRMLIPILTRQQADVTFFVIEQTDGASFNRAALHNVGFLEALKVADFNCFIFHDVDLVPLNDRNFYRCGNNPVHFAVKIQSGHLSSKKDMYKEYTGGVIGFTRQQYQVINGNSNLYFGWGGEDDDLYQRILNKNLTRDRASSRVALYRMLYHERQEEKQANPVRFQVLKTARKRQDIEGLNTVKYKVNQVRRERLYTWINVSLNITEMFMAAPLYTIQDIKTVMEKGQNVSHVGRSQ